MFSSLLFLRYSATKTGKTHKVKEIIILLFRTLFLLFLLLFLTGPLSKSFIKFKKATNVIFLVDDSYSMSAENNPTPFNEAKICMKKLLSSMKESSTEAGMIFLSGNYVPFTRNFSDMEKSIEKSHVSYYSGNLEPSIDKINKICAETAGNTIIYFFTDMQKYTWRNFSPSGLNPNIRFIIVNTGKNSDNNLSISSINKVSGRNVFSCRIVNWGKKNVVTDVVFNTGRNRITKTISIHGKNSTRVLFQTPPGTRTIEAKIIKPDLIPDDNSFFLSLAGNKNRKILVAGDDVRGVFYVKSALESESDPPYNVTVSPATSLNSPDMDKYSMIFLINPGILKTKTAEDIRSFIHKGGNVVFFAGNKVSPGTFNNYWYAPGEKSSPMPAQLTGPVEFKKGAKIVWIETENPVFRGFGDKIFQYLRAVSFSRCYGVKNVSGEVLAKLQGNLPVILEKNEGKGTMFFLPFSPDLSWTDFPEQPFFPVLINNIALYFLENESSLAHPGNTIFVAGNQNSTKVYDPSGKERKISTVSRGTIGFIPDSPGFWKVSSFNNGTIKHKIFSVNCNWKEGNPGKISMNEIKKIMAGTPVSYIEADRINTFIAQHQHSSNLSIPFLIIACIFLIGEMTVSNFFHNRKMRAK